MNIVVCLKWVISTDSPIRIEGDVINKRGTYQVINPYDMLAVEEAVRIKEMYKGSEVTIICLGPPSAESGIRRCLAMGADKGIIIWDNALESIDDHATAFILAKAISLLDYNLIICGQKAADLEGGQTGTILAHVLKIPVVSAAVKVDLPPDNGKLTVHRKLLRGNRDIVETVLPALITVEIGLNKPRYPALRSIFDADKKELRKYDLKQLDINPEEIKTKGYKTSIAAHSKPRPKPKKLFTPDSSLSAIERMNLIMSGGVTKKQSNILEGNTDYIATNAIRFLEEQKLLSDK